MRAHTSSSLRLFIPNRDVRLRIKRLYFVSPDIQNHNRRIQRNTFAIHGVSSVSTFFLFIFINCG